MEEAEAASASPAAGGQLSSLSQKELLDIWNGETVFANRDKILAELKRRGLFPSMQEYIYEMTTGAYPDAAIYKDRGQHRARDPEFLQKLLARREFAESLQHDWQLPVDPCGPGLGFELTPVQRFVANFMSPKTPYESALLFHGVGVGKTCAAVQVAESWLDMYPSKKVVIVAPKIIRRGFKKNICDFANFSFGDTPDAPNKVPGCTGTKYLELSDTLYMRPKAKKTEDDYAKQIVQVKDQIERRVKAQISRRYDFYGYGAFANAIIALLKPSQLIADPIAREEDMRERINEMFDGTLLIIDEAHNLRETNEIGQDLPNEDSESPGGKSDEDDSKDGKKLTPFLKMVLRYTVGMKLLLMTATPMYNSYKEIIFLMNLMLRNDGQAEINETDIFDPETGKLSEDGAETLGLIASRYVSFMRGENPQSFPLRLAPEDRRPLEIYPGLDPRGMHVDDAETIYMDHLPIITTELTGDALRAVRHFSDGLPKSKKGITTNQLGKLLQAGNLVVPLPEGIEEVGNSDEDLASRVDIAALQLHFQRRTVNKELVYQPRQPNSARWLGYDQLGEYSPKFVKALEYVRKAEGVCFIYTRFVGAGAVPLALALEANGYLPYDRTEGLLGGGAVTPGGFQCALCSRRQAEHKEVADHKFVAARYILLTGDSAISPRNEAMVEAAQQALNVNGSIVKVVIGSAVASEGVDLRYIREVHILEPWYHLNKTEQIIGRGIRFRSHCALPVEKRNTTIYLHASVRPAEDNRESADLYSYRIAFQKSRLIGQVTRIMKEYAIDCNLNHDAIIIQNTDPLRRVVDSQGSIRENMSMDDMPFTAVCDWMEECDYQCAVPIKVDPAKADDISYDEYSARWREGKLRQRMRALFAQQAYYSIEKLTSQLFADVPKAAQADLLYKIVGNRKFTVNYKGREGFIIYKNGYYLFQPLGFVDANIPLALRIAPYPIKVETYQPRDIFAEVMERLKAKRAAIAEAEERGNEEGAAAAAAEVEAADEEFEATAAPKKEAGRTLDELVQLWNAYIDWFTRLTSYDEPRKINKESWPATVGFFIQERAAGQQKEEERLTNRYEVLQWFAVSCLPWTPEKKDLFIKSALQLVWDEEFGDEDRETLLFSGELPASLRSIVADQHFLTVKLENTYNIVRLLNADINEVEYYCNGQERCKQAIITYIETNRDSPDPFKGTVITLGTTGPIYGFVSTEKGGYTFKSSVPPDPSKKERMKAGEKCDNNSQTNKHRTKIVELGRMLEAAGKGNYSLTEPILDKSTRKIVNVKRMCMLFDFTLRYMDNMGLFGKRWFYRPLEARKAGHTGKK